MTADSPPQSVHRSIPPVHRSSLSTMSRTVRASNVALRTLIVDDEPVARRILREELAEIDGVETVGEADGGEMALRLIEQCEPDLVLLDLQMPEVSGFEVVRRIARDRRPPHIVIVTAWDQHALQAFEAGAIDYLLKPVSHARLAQAIDRVRRVSGRDAAEKLAQLQHIADPTGPPRRIVGRAGDEYFLLAISEIFAFEADGDVVWIHAVKRKYQATQTLGALERRLAATSFRRIHRSVLVNVSHVRKMSPLSSQRWLITLRNNQEFIASKRQASGIRNLLT